jgi:hypothetical protein
MFNEWLRTVYSRCFTAFAYPLLTLLPSIPLGEEEKKKRSLPGALSFLSLAVPHPVDTIGPTADTVNFNNDALPSDGNSGTMDISLPLPMGDGNLRSPNPSPQPLLAMDSADDIPPFNGDLSLMRSLFFPTNASDPQHLDSPPPLPIETGSVGHSEVPDPVYELGIFSRLPLPPPVDLAPNLPLFQPIDPPGDTPVTPCPDVPTPRSPLTHPPLTSAGNGAFDLTSVLGDFISESVRTYWESVPGGEKWVAMVQSYLLLQTIPPSKDVRVESSFVL